MTYAVNNNFGAKTPVFSEQVKPHSLLQNKQSSKITPTFSQINGDLSNSASILQGKSITPIQYSYSSNSDFYDADDESDDKSIDERPRLQQHMQSINLKPNPSEAFRLCRLAAQNNVAASQFFLSTLYREGLGTPVNLEKSKKCCQRALKKKDTNAQAIVGKLLLTTAGSFNEMIRRGRNLLKTAAAKKHPLALHVLKTLKI